MKEKIKFDTEKIKYYSWIFAAVVIIFFLTAFTELSMGRLFFGSDGKFGWWEGNIWSSEQSQRFADPYSFTHIIHGLLFYLIVWLSARKMPVRYRFLIAVILEAGWEIMENSPLIIDRYRAVTISLGYVGDSVINSLSDILMMIIGFLLAARWKVWMSVVLVILIELVLLLLMKDNLTLNIIMLIFPLEAIKSWQIAGHVIP
ncbi:MAG TPA: DUF2585 family protein [Candidatus Nanoarchaeia archaeon]|nr:DUF2585 family protein [Candidatus Nanoarchaeia archaeon]